MLAASVRIAGGLGRNWDARQESNLQPPILENGALPVELLTCRKFDRARCPIFASLLGNSTATLG